MCHLKLLQYNEMYQKISLHFISRLKKIIEDMGYVRSKNVQVPTIIFINTTKQFLLCCLVQFMGGLPGKLSGITD